jgi:hypothetical protein
MIISASRRTDIPAFYAKWFINRIRSGYCTVPNPFNRQQVSRISLKPEDIEAIVFWTRYAQPLFPYLEELDLRKIFYYFQYTVLGYPRLLDVSNPPLEINLKVFRRLADRIGPERIIWRYDPIVFSRKTDKPFHLKNFHHIAQTLKGFTHRCVISIVDIDNYHKVRTRLSRFDKYGLGLISPDSTLLADLLTNLAQIASVHHMKIISCAEDLPISQYGIKPGKCVDDDLIAKLFPDIHNRLSGKKDPHQRKACGCAVSKDIGMFNTCLFGCQYCYATASSQSALNNYRQRHNPDSPSLLDHYREEDKSEDNRQGTFSF